MGRIALVVAAWVVDDLVVVALVATVLSMCQRIRSGLGVRMTFDLAAQLQLVQELRHLILVQAKRFLHGFTAELHTAEREEIERELFQRLRRRFQRCRIKRAGTG